MFVYRYDPAGFCRAEPYGRSGLAQERWHLILLLTIGLLYSAIAQAQSNALINGRQGCGAPPRSHVDAAPVRRFVTAARYPHDPHAFTQGLVFYRGELYESTGLRGSSSVRRLDLKSGRVLKTQHLDKALFGEGLTVIDHQLVQLTWVTGSALFYSPVDLEPAGSFTFNGEGWGSTAVNNRLVISDGTARLRFFDTQNYQQVGSLEVKDGGIPVEGLNELESVEGLIYANVYPSDCIAQIDARTGKVLGWLELTELMPRTKRPDRSAVANGIAYNPETRKLFVTGKLWPYIYQIKLVQPDNPDKQTAASNAVDRLLQ